MLQRDLNGPAVDQVLAEEDATGNVSWLLTDNEGSVRDVAVYDAALGQTTIEDHIVYDAYGNIVSQTNPSAQPSVGYTGQLWDPATGLYYYHARWYNPQTGTFLSQDPLSFAAGQTNLTCYVGNSPTNATDPSGKDAVAMAPTSRVYQPVDTGGQSGVPPTGAVYVPLDARVNSLGGSSGGPTGFGIMTDICAGRWRTGGRAAAVAGVGWTITPTGSTLLVPVGVIVWEDTFTLSPVTSSPVTPTISA